MKKEIDIQNNQTTQASIDATWEEKLRKVFSWVSGIVLTTFFSSAMFLVLYRDIMDGAWYKIAQQHFAAVIGLPMAALGALGVVRIFRCNNQI